MDEADFFWALIEPLWPDASVRNELRHIAKATPGQRALYVLTLFMREVDNGGLEQFFFNSSGMYSEEVQKALRLLGAHDQLSAFEAALEIFPDGTVPEDQEERTDLVEAIPKQQRKRFFESLNERLYGEERLWPHFQRYIDAHPEEFFVNEGDA